MSRDGFGARLLLHRRLVREGRLRGLLRQRFVLRAQLGDAGAGGLRLPLAGRDILGGRDGLALLLSGGHLLDPSLLRWSLLDRSLLADRSLLGRSPLGHGDRLLRLFGRGVRDRWSVAGWSFHDESSLPHHREEPGTHWKMCRTAFENR